MFTGMYSIYITTDTVAIRLSVSDFLFIRQVKKTTIFMKDTLQDYITSLKIQNKN